MWICGNHCFKCLYKVKYLSILILAIVVLPDCYSQNKHLDDDEEAFICDFGYCIEPEFPGGTDALKNFIINNYKTPNSFADSLTSAFKGTILAKFGIRSNGKPCCFEIVNSINAAFDSECIRVLKRMPDWKPAIGKSQNVLSWHRIPITIIIDIDSTQDCFDSLLLTKNTSTPAIAIKLPHKANHSVEINKNIQMATEIIIGTGNSHILNGNPFVPNFFRSNTTPTAWPMNCTIIRIARIELMTSDNLNNKLNINPSTHNTINEI